MNDSVDVAAARKKVDFVAVSKEKLAIIIAWREKVN